MSCVNISDIQVLNNPARFSDILQFQITFECVSQIKEEWCLTYVGSSESSKFDQVLENIMLGPISVGTSKFILQSNPPDINSIPKRDVLGVTVILLTCSYRSKEFIRVGYYVNNELPEIERIESENPEEVRIIDQNVITRNILANEPRVTRFHNDWDNDPEVVSNTNNFTPIEIGEGGEEIEEDDEEEEEEEDDEDEEDEEEDEDDEDEIDLSGDDEDNGMDEEVVRTFNFS